MCDTMGKILEGNGALFAKNSDRSPNEPQVVEFYPRLKHRVKKVQTTYIEVEQVDETKAMILSRPSWMWGGEMGVNECGVCIGNEAVFTKGKYGETGLTGMDMLRIALERSGNAKEALQCIIDHLEKYGQGGNCGYDHKFFYDNAFLIMDKSEMYILETAGKEWVYKKVDQAAISNRLSIGEDGDVYSSGKCDFAKQHMDSVYTYFSKSEQRKAMCQSGVEKAESIEDMFAIMRQHADEKNPMCKASVGSPCMHYGGLVGDHTTQSMAVELRENGQICVWVTGCSLPCISLYKPFLFGNKTDAPIYSAKSDKAKDYWLKMEQIHRSMLGYIVPKEYYAERDEIEKNLLSMSRNASSKEWQELSLYAMEKEAAFVKKWSRRKFEMGGISAVFQRQWEKKKKYGRNKDWTLVQRSKAAKKED